MLTSNQLKRERGVPTLYFLFGAAILLLSILFRLAAVFRLSIPLLYALVVPTLFSGWYYSHQALAEGIWYAMLAVALLSWVYSLVRKIAALVERLRSGRLSPRRRRNSKAAGSGTLSSISTMR